MFCFPALNDFLALLTVQEQYKGKSGEMFSSQQPVLPFRKISTDQSCPFFLLLKENERDANSTECVIKSLGSKQGED